MLRVDSLSTPRFWEAPGPAGSFGRMEDVRIRIRPLGEGSSTERQIEIFRRG
jgi:hypothetical protein